MKILVINAGSSSLKYQLIDMDGEKVIAKGLVERIGIKDSVLKYKSGEISTELTTDIKDHVQAISMVLNALIDKEKGCIKDMKEIGAVGHRVVLRGQRNNNARGYGGHPLQYRSGAPAQSGQHNGHRGMSESYAGHAHGGRI